LAVVVSCQQFGISIPFVDSLKASMSMPEVRHHIQNPHTSHTQVMSVDVGYYLWASGSETRWHGVRFV